MNVMNVESSAPGLLTPLTAQEKGMELQAEDSLRYHLISAESPKSLLSLL